MKEHSREIPQRSVGVDLGDRWSRYCVLDVFGEELEQQRVQTREVSLRRVFGRMKPARIALEVGPHSPWVSRLLQELGHEVWVANARKLRLIYQSGRKNDQLDASSLARLARFDPQLLFPIRHRGRQAQADRALLLSREGLVRARTQLINHVRGLVKAYGSRLPKASAGAFVNRVAPMVPEALQEAVTPVLEQIGMLTEQIRQMNKQVEKVARERYEETQLLRQIPGVGPITSLAYVLTLEDPQRFARSRMVGAYLGLVPRSDQSGGRDPQLRITKQGDAFLRKLLVQAAHFILGAFGPDSDLRRFGLTLAARGGKNAKKRAVVAVARKLAVLMHRLWRNGEAYEPLYLASQETEAA